MNTIDTIATEVALFAIGETARGGGVGALEEALEFATSRPYEPVGGDWDALAQELGRQPTNDERQAFARACAEAFERLLRERLG